MRQRPLQHSKRIGAAGWDGGFSTLHDTKSVFLTFSTPVCVGHQAGGLPGTAGRSGRFGPGTRGTFAAARCHLEENVVFSVHVEMNGDSFTPKSPNNSFPSWLFLQDLQRHGNFANHTSGRELIHLDVGPLVSRQNGFAKTRI